MRLVLGLGGAVASALAPGVARLSRARGFELRVVATEAALRFASLPALEAMVEQRVFSSMWPEEGGLEDPHLDLAAWADVVLVCPASTTTISRLAAGYPSTLLAALSLHTRAPVLLAPSEEARGEGSKLEQLITEGFHVVHPRAFSFGAGPGPAPMLLDMLEVALRLADPKST